MKRITHSLAIKLTACVVGGMALLFSIYGYWNLRLWRQSQQEIIFQSADRISDTIRRSIRYSMLRNQREEVFHIINTIGHENGISRIRIFNKEGQISFSTDDQEVGQFVDKNAEACYACHAQAQPLARLDRPDRMRIYTRARRHARAGTDPAHRKRGGLFQRRLPRPHRRQPGAGRARHQSLAGRHGPGRGAA